MKEPVIMQTNLGSADHKNIESIPLKTSLVVWGQTVKLVSPATIL